MPNVLVVSNGNDGEYARPPVTVRTSGFRAIAVCFAAATLGMMSSLTSEAQADELRSAQILELSPEPQSKTLELTLGVPSTVRVRAMRATEDCDYMKAVLYYGDRPISDVKYTMEVRFPTSDGYSYPKYDPLINVVLPSGSYRLSLSDGSTYDEKPPRIACKAVVLTDISSISRSDDNHKDSVGDAKALLLITRRLIETNLVETVPLNSVEIRSRRNWTAPLLVKFLTYYCKNHNQRVADTFSFDGRAFASGVPRPVPKTVGENSEHVHLTPFFEATLEKYIVEHFDNAEAKKESQEDFSEWLEPADLVCRAELPALEQFALSFGDTIRLLQSSKSVRYLVGYSIVNAEADDARNYQENPLYSEYVQTASVFADALGVKTSEISLYIHKGNCSRTLNFISLTRPRYTGGFCYSSSSNNIQLTNFMGGVKRDTPRPISGKVVSLMDAVASVLPTGGVIEWLDRDDLGVRVKVRNVRGWVSSSSNYWERAFITAALLGAGKDMRLFVVVDGSVCSGAGSLPPAEDNCLKSMDTVANYNLAEFAKAVSGRIAAALVQQ